MCENLIFKFIESLKNVSQNEYFIAPLLVEVVMYPDELISKVAVACILVKKAYCCEIAYLLSKLSVYLHVIARTYRNRISLGLAIRLWGWSWVGNGVYILVSWFRKRGKSWAHAAVGVD